MSSNGSHGHWKESWAIKRRWKLNTIRAIGLNMPDEPLKKARCTFVRSSTSEPDDDNLRISFKPIRDALKVARVIEDDKPENMPDPVYKWERGKRGKGYIKVIVEGVE